MLRILFCSVNPPGTQTIDLTGEYRALEDRLRADGLSPCAELRHISDATFDVIEHALRSFRPNVLYFYAHEESASLQIESPGDTAASMRPMHLGSLPLLLGTETCCLVLNASQSSEQAQARLAEVPCVVSMQGGGLDPSTLRFSTSFYAALVAGDSVANAFMLARNSAYGIEQLGSKVPIFYSRPGADALSLVNKVKIFCLYSAEDLEYYHDLDRRLAIYKRAGMIELLSPAAAPSTTNVSRYTEDQLDEANVVLCLGSDDFIADDRCAELTQRVLRRANALKALPLGIIVRACAWADAPLGHLLTLPRSGTARTGTNQAEWWKEVTAELLAVLRERAKQLLQALWEPMMPKVQHLRDQTFATSDLALKKLLLPVLVKAETYLADRPQQTVPSIPLFETIVTPLGSSERTINDSTTKGSSDTGVDCQVMLRMAQVPTGLVHLFDVSKNPLLTFRVRNDRKTTARLRFTSFVEGYSARSIDTVTVRPGELRELNHLPAFFLEKVRSLDEICRAALHIQVDDLAGSTEEHRTFSVWLMPRTSAYLWVNDPATGEMQDFSHYLGAWVTPNNPAVLNTLRCAADHLEDKAILGYQDGKGVENQVKAIYMTLHQMGIVPVNSVHAMSVGPGPFLQRVRLPRESISTRSISCLDGAILMASLLESASISPALVLVPGYAFLGWQTSETGTWDYLDTACLGSRSFEDARAMGRLLAEQYQDQQKIYHELGEVTRWFFKRLPIASLRQQYIFPME